MNHFTLYCITIAILVLVPAIVCTIIAEIKAYAEIEKARIKYQKEDKADKSKAE